MPDPFQPTDLFLPRQDDFYGDLGREAGVIDVRDYAAGRAQQEAEEQAAFAAYQDQIATQRMEAVNQQQQEQYAASEAQFLDWPTYQREVAGNDPAHMAYDEYVGASLPWQLEQMGYSPEDAQREVQLFMQQVPRPAADYGFWGNLRESATSGFQSGTRALESARNILTGNTDDLARLIAEQGSVQGDVPDVIRRFNEGSAAGDNTAWGAVSRFFGQAVDDPVGLLNNVVQQAAQSYPSIAGSVLGGGAGLLAGPVGGLAGLAGGAGAGSATTEAGLDILSRIATTAQERGINPQDTKAVAQLLQDRALYEDLRNTALQRGATIGLVDGILAAVSGGLGGRAASLARAGRGGAATGLAATGLGIESVGAGAGEYAGEVVAGDPINWTDIVAEAGLGAVTGAPNVALGALGNTLRRGPQDPGLNQGDLAAEGEPTEELLRLGLNPRDPNRPQGMDDRSGDILNEEQRAASAAIQARVDAMWAARDETERRMAELNTVPQGGIEVTEGDVQEINVAEPTFGMPTTPSGAIGVTEIPGIEATEPTFGMPARPSTAMGVQEIPEQAVIDVKPIPLDLNNVEDLIEHMVARNINVGSDELHAALELVASVPDADKSTAIASVIEDLIGSANPDADAVSLELIRIARTLRPDAPLTPQQVQAGVAQVARTLGVAPEQAMPVVAQALAQDLVQGASVNATTSTQPAANAVAPPVAPTTAGPARTLRRGTRAPSAAAPAPAPVIPDLGLGSLAGQLIGGGPAGPAGGAVAAPRQSRSGLRAGIPQEGTGQRGVRRGEGAAPVGSAPSDRAVADDTTGAGGSGRRVTKQSLLRQQERQLKPYSGEIAENEAEGEARERREPKMDTGALSRFMAEIERNPEAFDEAAGWTEVEGGVTQDTLSPAFVRAINMSGMPGVVDMLRSVHPNALTRLIMGKIADLRLSTPIRVGPLEGTKRGTYVFDRFRSRDQITIDPSKASINTLVHEITHAATVAAYQNPQTPMQQQAAARMRELYDYVNQRDPSMKDYGMTNVEEFIAETFANQGFRDKLKAIPLPNASKYGIRNVLDAFKRLVLRLLGLNTSDNVLSEAILAGADLLSDRKPGQSMSLAEAGTQVQNAYASTPSNAILGDKNGIRTFIAYPKAANKWTLYPVTNNPRGDSAGKINDLTRQQVETLITNAGSTALPPRGDSTMSAVQPKEKSTQLVGYNADGVLNTVAFEQKDGTWTYYESTNGGDVRRDANARVLKGVTKSQVERTMQQKNLNKTPPKNGTIKPGGSETPTTVGYKSSKLTNVLTSFRSRNQSVYDITEQIDKQDPNATREDRVDTHMVLFNSNVMRKWAEQTKTFIEPMQKAGADLMRTFNKTEEQVWDAMMNLHIIERLNHKIRQTQNSAQSPEAKAAFTENALKEIEKAERAIAAENSANPQFIPSLKSQFAPKVQALANDTLDRAAAYGLLSREAVENMKKAYDFYIPLQTGDRTTTGKAATGKSVKGDMTFARLVEQARRTVSRGEQNTIRQKMRDLAQQYNIIDPTSMDPLVELGPKEVIRYNEEKNTLESGQDSMMFDDDAVPVFDNGARQYMKLNDPNVLAAMRKYTGAERDSVVTAAIGLMGMTNHIISIGKTALSPVFPLFNVIRDAGMTQLNPYPGVSRLTTIKYLADPRTWYESYKNSLRMASGYEPTGDFKEFADAGGTISQKAYVGLSPIVQEGMATFVPTSWSKLKKGGKRGFELASVWAQGMESGTRYAVWKAAKEADLSDQQAAVAAKTTTLNFEERGTTNISPYYIFGNAKVQGLYNMYKVLEKMGGRNAALFGMSVMGVGLMAGWAAYQDSEKDKDGKKKYLKIPHYKKDSMVPLGGEGSFGIPFPQELQPFYVPGSAIADGVWGGASTGEVVSRIATAWLNTLWPGNVPQGDIAGFKARPSEFFLRTVFPSQIQPFLDIGLNTTTFGSPLVYDKNEKLKRGIPLRDMGAAGTESDMAVNSKSIAQGIYDVTGFDVAPQQIAHLNAYFNPLAEQAGFWRDMFGMREEKYQGDVVNPIKRKFTSQVTPFYDQDQFDELLAHARQAKYQAEKNGINSLLPEQQALAQSAKMLEDVKNDANGLFKNSHLMSAERKKQLNERKQELLLSGIRRYNERKDTLVPRK